MARLREEEIIPGVSSEKEDNKGAAATMHHPAAKALYLLLMITIIVGVDLAFFRGSSHTLERLIANVVIVGLFVGGYFAFLK